MQAVDTNCYSWASQGAYPEQGQVPIGACGAVAVAVRPPDVAAVAGELEGAIHLQGGQARRAAMGAWLQLQDFPPRLTQTQV